MHQGSLYTALASWLDARAAAGEWLVRIEDVDRQRRNPALAADILRTLEACALTWDGEVRYQSTREDSYAAAVAQLSRSGLLYPCTCTRGELPAAPDPDTEAVYPGTCRAGPTHPERDAALRLHAPDESVTVTDRLRGVQAEDVARGCGDFVVRRRDGSYAYPLAVVVDDADQRITDVVRGMDLWPQTPRQRLLQQLLGLPPVRYLHVPLVVEPDGRKLAKSRRAVPVDRAAAGRHVCHALAALGLPPPADLRAAAPAEMLQWAVRHWSPGVLPPGPVPAWPEDP